jgi:hypothetical protein
VTVNGDSGVAVSRGPYWMENLAPDAKEKWMAGRFISTWVRDAKGTWHVPLRRRWRQRAQAGDAGGDRQARRRSQDVPAVANQ